MKKPTMGRPARVLGLIFILAVQAMAVKAGEKDYVKEVFVCGPDVFIRMQNAGWLIAPEGIGQKLQDRIMSVALTLLSTGKPSGYFSEGGVIPACGIATAKHTTALGISSGG